MVLCNNSDPKKKQWNCTSMITENEILVSWGSISISHFVREMHIDSLTGIIAEMVSVIVFPWDLEWSLGHMQLVKSALVWTCVQSWVVCCSRSEKMEVSHCSLAPLNNTYFLKKCTTFYLLGDLWDLICFS